MVTPLVSRIARTGQYASLPTHYLFGAIPLSTTQLSDAPCCRFHAIAGTSD
jgi:hypothetical protein